MPRHVHLLGICGVGMVGLARLFQSAGSKVTGSDQTVYPPMSDLLQEMGVQIMEGYRPENLLARPDLAIVGNVIRSTNPEAQALSRLNIPYTSMAGALESFFLKDRTRVVIAGTHGKTTLTSMISWILFDQGMDPGFFVGGIPGNFGFNSRLGHGRCFVVEGDEYDTAYFDKAPKFLHYIPDVAVITSVEFDHADIYSDLAQIKSQFHKFVSIIPKSGSLIASSDYSAVRAVTRLAECGVHYYGENNNPEWSLGPLNHHPDGLALEIRKSGKSVAKGKISVPGVHNALNALAAVAAVWALGVSPDVAIRSLENFQGVMRRQQIYEHQSGITLIDDFAHHPTAVRLTCDAIKARYPDRRVIAVFEPRTNTSRRSIFQKEYATSFSAADVIVLREPHLVGNHCDSDVFDSQKLSCDLRLGGKCAEAFGNADQILDYLVSIMVSGDVALIMSNGNFEGLRLRLLNRLDEVTK